MYSLYVRTTQQTLWDMQFTKCHVYSVFTSRPMPVLLCLQELYVALAAPSTQHCVQTIMYAQRCSYYDIGVDTWR